MSEGTQFSKTARDLRNEFDHLYSLPRSLPKAGEMENLLVVRLAGVLYAIRLAEISGLESKRKIVSIPSPVPEVLGIAGIRGKLVSVYSLAALLGYAPETAQHRWMVLCGNEDQAGLAFGEFEGYLQIPAAQVHASSQKEAGHLVEHMALTKDTACAILNIPSLVDTIRRRCGEPALDPSRSDKKER